MAADHTPSAASNDEAAELQRAADDATSVDSSAAQIADRLTALNAAANRHGSDHELSAVCSHLHSELPKLAADLDQATVALQTCLHRGSELTGRPLSRRHS